jgi:hypothetical protein
MDGAGRLIGDLTPECSAAVTAVLEALGKKRGPEDDRTAALRFHDAQQEGCEFRRGPCRVRAAPRCLESRRPVVCGVDFS